MKEREGVYLFSCFFYLADIHMLSENEPGFRTLHASATLVELEAEKKIEDLKLEAKIILPQV